MNSIYDRHIVKILTERFRAGKKKKTTSRLHSKLVNIFQISNPVLINIENWLINFLLSLNPNETVCGNFPFQPFLVFCVSSLFGSFVSPEKT